MMLALALLAAFQLPPAEQRIRAAVTVMRDDQVAYLERMTNIASSTLNLEGVRRVGALYRASLDSLGFTTRWVELPETMRRAGHLVAEHRGRPGAARLLLLGHFDTVEDSSGSWRREGNRAFGVGSTDMKGGDVILLYALRALHQSGELRDLNITVVMTGDEEDVGFPIPVSRTAMTDAARASDLALSFEGGNRNDATVARRGSSNWRLFTTGTQAHSSGIFGRSAGYGAIYEMARILNEFREALAGEEHLTFNVATIVGGTDVTYDSVTNYGTAGSKLNIVPRTALAYGDLRFLTDEQKERARARMREIVARNLPGTEARIEFENRYPGMAPTPGNLRILGVLDSVSRDLGYGPVAALDPGRRGAGDVSFVAPIIDGIDGLGSLGAGSHAPGEFVDLSTLPMQTERAALLIRRLGARPSSEFRR